MTRTELRVAAAQYLETRLQSDTMGRDEAFLAVLISIARDLYDIAEACSGEGLADPLLQRVQKRGI